MNKGDLVEALEGRLGGKKAAAEALEAVLDVIIREVARGGKVGITGFGTFEKAARAARTGRNPRTGETVKIKKTAVPKFKAGTAFRLVVALDHGDQEDRHEGHDPGPGCGDEDGAGGTDHHAQDGRCDQGGPGTRHGPQGRTGHQGRHHQGRHHQGGRDQGDRDQGDRQEGDPRQGGCVVADHDRQEGGSREEDGHPPYGQEGLTAGLRHRKGAAPEGAAPFCCSRTA